MNELKYLIFQSLIHKDINAPRRQVYRSVKSDLEKERVHYDPEMIEVLIEVCLSELEAQSV